MLHENAGRCFRTLNYKKDKEKVNPHLIYDRVVYIGITP
jgi:hypothetical protein